MAVLEEKYLQEGAPEQNVPGEASGAEQWYPILRKVREGWGTRSFLHVSHTQVPIRIHSRGRISTALTRRACRNVRTKRTKLTKSGCARLSYRDGTIFRPTWYVLGKVPSVIRRFCHHGPGLLGLISGVWRFSSCQNCLIKRSH